MREPQAKKLWGEAKTNQNRNQNSEIKSRRKVKWALFPF